MRRSGSPHYRWTSGAGSSASSSSRSSVRIEGGARPGKATSPGPAPRMSPPKALIRVACRSNKRAIADCLGGMRGAGSHGRRDRYCLDPAGSRAPNRRERGREAQGPRHDGPRLTRVNEIVKRAAQFEEFLHGRDLVARSRSAVMALECAEGLVHDANGSWANG